MSNFKSPYFSFSVKEFWSRWHISLSTWFRDYVYIPLGGNRVSRRRHGLNLLVTFLVSGLWHGAAWTYVIWGGVHGIAQVLENLFCRERNRSGRNKTDGKRTGMRYILPVFKIVLVFVFVSFAWIFFRAQSLSDAAYVIRYTLSGIGSPIQYLKDGILNMGLEKTAVVTCIGMIGILGIYDGLSLKYDVIECIGRWKPLLRWPVYLMIVLLILFLAPIGNASSFIYFQF